MTIRRLIAMLLLLGCWAAPANAWWSGEWSYRKSLEMTPATARLQLAAPLTEYTTLVRLTAQNFTFSDAKVDGSDLRFVGADDKTPLPFFVESFDAQAKIASIWVRLPAVAGDKPTPFFMYYGNERADAAGNAADSFDASEMLALDFGRGQGALRDLTKSPAQLLTALPTGTGFAGNGARLSGQDALIVGPSADMATAQAGSFTVQMWVRLDAPQAQATLYSRSGGGRPALALGIVDRNLVVDVAGAVAQAQQGVAVGTGPLGSRLVFQNAAVPVGSWTHVALVKRGGSPDQLQVFLNGELAGTVAVAVPALDGPTIIGALTAAAGANGAATGVTGGFAGQLDMVRVANVARGGDVLRATYLDQSGKGLLTYGPDTENAGGAGYFGAIVDNLTIEGWVVIGILTVMLIVALWVMIQKAGEVATAERENAAFETAFEEGGDPAELDMRFPGSPKARLARIVANDLRSRTAPSIGAASVLSLRPAAVEAVRARIDGGVAREAARLNKNMVLLTIAIAGGPFLGLLGTVIGVMITFAAIAVEGNVNVQAIAPGVAAALLATAAGLAVAIPALFGYNYLTTRIRDIVLESRVFAETLIARVNDRYGQ